MVSVERCSCGQEGCRKFWLVGAGVFVQGSGFNEAEALKIARLLNGEVLVGFGELLETQHSLQAAMGMPCGAGLAGAKENLVHAVVEVVEALQEINFKPWKPAQKSVDRQAFATELTDAVQFLANAANALGITGEDLSAALRAKWQENKRRIEAGEVMRAR